MLQLFSRKETAGKTLSKGSQPAGIDAELFEPAAPLKLEADSLRRCLQLERYGYLLSHAQDWQDRPDLQQACRAAREEIDEQFALVPEGSASLPQVVLDYPGCPEETLETEPFLVGRYTVTNAQYQKFVEAGGYDQLDLWPKDIWPHLIDFKDLTARPGPRFWQNGRPDRRLLDHPVVGISQYESAAYARWAGYRLLSEHEWQMAATWRIRSEANVMRRYPWGDALDVRRCNIWASGVGTTVPVQAYPEGVAPNQVYQLIGNVWEWVAGAFEVTAESGAPVLSDMRMSPIRGGAFDTYFPQQATSVFRTGLVSLARVHNVGFRCAMDLGGQGE